MKLIIFPENEKHGNFKFEKRSKVLGKCKMENSSIIDVFYEHPLMKIEKNNSACFDFFHNIRIYLELFIEIEKYQEYRERENYTFHQFFYEIFVEFQTDH